MSAGAGLQVPPQLPEREPPGAPLLAMTHRCAQAAGMRPKKSFLLFSFTEDGLTTSGTLGESSKYK